MKEINSLFKKPEQYIVTAILSLGSFSACFYGLTEYGFVSGELLSIWVFRTIAFLFIIIPALFPFHHLLVSGRNGLVHLVYPLLALLLLIGTFCFPPDQLLKYEWVALIPCAIWLLLLYGYHVAGTSFKNSARKEVWVKENVFVEIAIIGAILIIMLVLGISSLFTFNYIKNSDAIGKSDVLSSLYFQDTFIRKDHAHTLKRQIDDTVFKNKILNTIYETNRQAFFEKRGFVRKTEAELVKHAKATLDSILEKPQTSYDKIDIDSVTMPKLGEIYSLRYDSLKDSDALHTFNQAYLNTLVHTRMLDRSIFLQRLQFTENEQQFAKRFEQIVKRYQAVGTILLALAGLAILVLLFFELGHREYRNRLRIQLFMILTLMIPLNKTIRKEDITIDKPFGDTVFNRKNIITTPGDKILMDTTGLAQEATIKDLPRHIDTIMTSLLNDINYVNYVLSINDIKTRRIDSLYPGKPDTLRRSKPRP